VIEPTDEMKAVFRAAQQQRAEELAAENAPLGAHDILDRGLAAVLAIVERDYDVRCGALHGRYFGEVRCDAKAGHDGEHRNIDGDSVVFW
jgi:hypothetical protein